MEVPSFVVTSVLKGPFVLPVFDGAFEGARWPVPEAARSKAWVCGRSRAGVVGCQLEVSA
jgi:hypothetical protein